MQKSALIRSIDKVPESRHVPYGASKPVSKNALLLQGPIGPFFSRFATDLTTRGFNVTKINFNGGDKIFHRSTHAIDYTGSVGDWEAWIERILVNRDISRIYLFGDCRVYHKIASQVAKRLDVKIYVFEEGYLRPNFITLEEDGVNGHSTMLSSKFTHAPVTNDLSAELQHPGHIFHLTAVYSMVYYMASALRRTKFSGYCHHRPFECIAEGGRWIRSGIRKVKYARVEKNVLSDLLAQYDGNYFVCPLQVHCDMQVIEHSDYTSIEQFIGEVLTSFKEYASSNKAIVFKHHPLDRGYTNYSSLFDKLVNELGLQGRVFYVHDACLPTLLKRAQGTVLINSTVGLSSLFHGTPVKTMGKAIYDIPGLTAQESLHEFWTCNKVVNSEFFKMFRSHLVKNNQLNANLYRRVSDENAAGIAWSEGLLAMHTWKDEIPEATTSRALRIVGKSKNDPDFDGDDVAKAA